MLLGRELVQDAEGRRRGRPPPRARLASAAWALSGVFDGSSRGVGGICSPWVLRVALALPARRAFACRRARVLGRRLIIEAVTTEGEARVIVSLENPVSAAPAPGLSPPCWLPLQRHRTRSSAWSRRLASASVLAAMINEACLARLQGKLEVSEAHWYRSTALRASRAGEADDRRGSSPDNARVLRCAGHSRGLGHGYRYAAPRALGRAGR